MTRLYNIVAELCSYVINSCDERVFLEFSCVSMNERRRNYDMIRQVCPVFFDAAGRVRKTVKEDFDEAFYKGIDRLIDEYKKKSDYFGIIFLLQIIDESLEGILQEEIAELQEEDFSYILNNNRETTGIGLLPRCTCGWERKRRLSDYYNRIDNCLYNFLLMENSILGELIDKHYYLKRGFFEKFDTNGKLKIATTALWRESNFEHFYNDKDRVATVEVKYYEHNDIAAENELIWQKILLAGKEGAEIIVFPEILGNAMTKDYISEKLCGIDESRRGEIPALIVLPSYWYNKKNIVYVLDKFGNLLFGQNKQNQFLEMHEGINYMENVIASNVVNIIHYEGIGRIAVLICKDFLVTKYMEQLMRCFKLSLILVPSYSSGSYDFLHTLDVCARDDCNVVWINTCSAVINGKEKNFENVGYVRKRISRDDDESEKLSKMNSCAAFKEGKCNRDCLFFETMGKV